jgi:pyruvate/2-oxoglutarate/acetoin dehydrogenase E1 component
MITVLDSLNSALRQALTADERVYLLGEDILDPYGGAFKVTRGLSTDFPGRVFTTPVSEAGIVGIASGMALRGLRPVVEIMFGDFITLIADQVINHAAKFRWMYNDQVHVPMVIRAPMGGRRGYGPTHSQTLEKIFLGVPGLQVLAPSALEDPGGLLTSAILESGDPTLFVENKLLYRLPVQNGFGFEDFEVIKIPGSSTSGSWGGVEIVGNGPSVTYQLNIQGAPSPVVTVAAYGYMAELARQAIHQLAFEHEVFAELVVPTRLAPFEIEPILASARRTGRLLTIEEGNLSLGWGSEIVTRTVEAFAGIKETKRLAALDVPIPASGPLESAVLPRLEIIVETIKKMAL